MSDDGDQLDQDVEPSVLDRRDLTFTIREDLWRQSLDDLAHMTVDASGEWLPIGPGGVQIGPNLNNPTFGQGPLSGVVTAIALDPQSPANHFYVGTSEGGLWASTDAGSTWQELTPDQTFTSIGALLVVPPTTVKVPPDPSIIFLGTGITQAVGMPGFTRGAGLFRSFDGGRTWNALDGGPSATGFAGAAITSILLLPGRLLVATTKGLFKSTDNGLSFSLILNGVVTGAYRDTDTVNFPSTIYACVATVGLFTSSDGGDHTSNLFNNLPPAIKALPFTNIAFAQGTSNRQVIYASVQYSPPAGPAVYNGLYASTNLGGAWQQMNDAKAVCDAGATSGAAQTDYDFTLGVDPANANWVYLGFQQLWRSTNGGQNFHGPVPAGGTVMTSSVAYGKIHWDHHALMFGPPGAAAPTRIYIGTDGGFSFSDDGGQNWTNPNDGINSCLVYGIGIGKGAANNFISIGLQDNGNPGFAGAPGHQVWVVNSAGDGRDVVIDPDQAQIVYGFQNGNIVRTTDGGNTWAQIGALALPIAAFQCLALGPVTAGGTVQNNRTVYVSMGASLFRSQLSGLDLKPGPVASGGSLVLTASAPITAITTTQSDPQRVWLGLQNGQVLLSMNGGTTYSPMFNGPGVRAVWAIAIDEADPATTLGRVAVAFGSFSQISPQTLRTQHVYLTEDNGAHWNDISGQDGVGGPTNLPDAAAYDVIFDTSTHSAGTPSRIIAAIDGGVVHSRDNGKTWQRLGVGLSPVACLSLGIDTSVNPIALRVATWGRSCYQFALPSLGLGSPAPILFMVSDLACDVMKTGQTSTKTVDVYNLGNQPLNISDFAWKLGSADFKVASGPTPAGPVAPGGKTSYQIAFTPSTAADLSAIFVVKSDDPSNSPWTLNVSGTGVGAGVPRLGIVPVTLDFGAVNGGASSNLTVTLANTGYDILNITGITSGGDPDFAVTPTPTFNPLNPGQNISITVQFKPTGNGPRKATFTVACNDPSAQPFSAAGVGQDVGSSVLLVVVAAIGIALIGGVVALGVYDAASGKKFGTL